MDNIDKRLQAVEKSLNHFAERLVYNEPPRESVAGGLKNITDIGLYMIMLERSMIHSSMSHMHSNLNITYIYMCIYVPEKIALIPCPFPCCMLKN